MFVNNLSIEKRRFWINAFIYIAFVISVVFVAIALCAKRTVEIDINSGRIRQRKSIGSVVFHGAVTDTAFSRLVADHWSSRTTNRWRIVSSESIIKPISRNYPHYRYGSIPNDLWQFLIECDNQGFSEKKQAKIAKTYLDLLRRDDPELLHQHITSFLQEHEQQRRKQ